MIVSAMATEICNRVGEGFSQHSARAKVLFWKAIGLMVKDGSIKKDEIRTLKMTASVTKDANGTAPVEVTLTDASPNGFATEIANNYIFDQDVRVFDNATPAAASDQILCSRITENQYESVRQLLSLSDLQEEILYCVKYPVVRIIKNSLITAAANVDVELQYYGIPKTTADANATELNNYFDTTVQNTAIEMAAELLRAEIV